MTKTTIALIAALAFAVVSMPAVQAKDRGKIISQGEDGSVCYEKDAEDDQAYVKKVEAMEKAGKLEEAFAAADKGMPFGCWDDDGERLDAVIERTYKKVGEKAEKAGKLHEAFQYYIYPFDRYIAPGYLRDRFEKKFTFADANRVMLAYAKANPDDFTVIEGAVDYFNRYRQQGPQSKETLALARRGGEKALEKEQQAFTAHKYKAALADLSDAKRWMGLSEDDRQVHARAKQRADTLLATGKYDDVERGFQYTFEFSLNLDAARARAGKLGSEAERRGDDELAAKFYSLAGEDAKHDALVDKMDKAQRREEKQKEEAEAKRQKKFKEEQKSLEDELGL